MTHASSRPGQGSSPLRVGPRSTRVDERSLPDLLRHPNDVEADLEAGDVLLRRRDEPDLRLTLADRDSERSDVFRVLAHSFRNLAVHSPGALEGAVLDAFAWSEFLPPKDRRAFLDEFSRTLIASAEMDTYAHLSQVVREWRVTAEIYTQPGLAKRLRQPVKATEGRAIAAPATA